EGLSPCCRISHRCTVCCGQFTVAFRGCHRRDSRESEGTEQSGLKSACKSKNGNVQCLAHPGGETRPSVVEQSINQSESFIMTLIVTGGAGFIGGNFVLDWLGQSDETIVNLDKLTYAGNPHTLSSL